MKDPVLDPRRQELVAALYGELDPEAEARFRTLLESDPVLREEWEELHDARVLLESAEETESAPVFVFLEPPREARRRVRGRILPRIFAGRLSPLWGFAGAVAVFAAFFALGLRVDRVPHGVTVHFGSEPAVVAQRTAPPVPPSVSPDPSSEGVRLEPAAQVSGPVTRDDFNAYSAVVLEAMADALSESQVRQRREMAYILERFYDNLIEEQDKKYEDLRARMDGVGLGLLAEQNRTNARLTRLIDSGQALPSPAGKPEITPPEEPEKDQKP